MQIVNIKTWPIYKLKTPFRINEAQSNLVAAAALNKEDERQTPNLMWLPFANSSSSSRSCSSCSSICCLFFCVAQQLVATTCGCCCSNRRHTHRELHFNVWGFSSQQLLLHEKVHYIFFVFFFLFCFFVFGNSIICSLICGSFGPHLWPCCSLQPDF